MFSLFFFKQPNESNFNCSDIPGCGTICRSIVDLPGATALKITNPSYPRSLQLVNSCSARVGALKAPSPGLECSLVQILWGLWIPVCNGPVSCRRQFYLSSPTSGSYNPPTTSSSMAPEPCQDGIWYKCPICGWALHRHLFLYFLTSFQFLH